MKVKYSVIPFIFAVIATVGLKMMSIFGLDGNGMFLGMNKMGITYAVIGISIALFLVCAVINIFDRKTAPVYSVKRNFVAGAFAILSGFAVAASSITTLLNTAKDSEYYLMTVVCAAFSIPAALALVLMSKVHFSGKTTISGVSMLFIFPALWGCSELVSEFLVATKVSISASDMTPLFCYIFITLYFFSHSMIVSRIKGRNPVKACFVYGLPAVAISLSYGLYSIFTAMVEGSFISHIFLGAELVILSLYALSFVIEMAFNAYTKDEVEILDGMPDDDDDAYDKSYVKSEGYDELVFSERGKNDENDDADNEETYIPSVSGLDDLIIGYGEDEKEPIAYVGKNNTAVVKNEPQINDADSCELVSDLEFIPRKKEPDNLFKVEEPVTKKSEKELSDIDLLLQELDSKK